MMDELQPTTNHSDPNRFHLPPSGLSMDFYLQGLSLSTRAHSPKTRTTARREAPRGPMSAPLYLSSLQDARFPLPGVLLAPVCLLSGSDNHPPPVASALCRLCAEELTAPRGGLEEVGENLGQPHQASRLGQAGLHRHSCPLPLAGSRVMPATDVGNGPRVQLQLVTLRVTPRKGLAMFYPG